MSDNGDRELWTNYRKFPTTENRNAIFDYWYPFIARTVEYKSRDSALPPEELLSFASERILSVAIPRFSSDKSCFQTYLQQSIHFAAMDAMREEDRMRSISRLARTRSKRLEDRIKWLTQEIGRNPTDSEVAEAAGKSERDVIGTKESIPLQQFVPSDRQTWGNEWHIHHTNDFLDWVSETDLKPDPKEAFEYSTRGLSDSRRTMLWRYYFEHYTMSEIGDSLGVSESRVSQEIKASREFLKKNRDKAEAFADLRG